MMIVDAHLDLAYNVTRGRDPRMPAKDQPVAHSDVAEIATVGLPDLRAGGIGLICATIFCAPAGYGGGRGEGKGGGGRARAPRGGPGGLGMFFVGGGWAVGGGGGFPEA